MTTARDPGPRDRRAGRPAMPVPPGAGLWAEAETAEARAHWAEARECYERLLRALPADRGAAVTAKVVRRVARCHIETADLDAALDCLALARVVSQHGGDAAGDAHAVNLTAIAVQQRGALGDAERLYLEARARAEVAGERLLVAMVDQNLGTIANVRGDHRAALARFEASLAGYKALGVERLLSPILNNLGMVHADLRNWQVAERCFAEARTGATRLGDAASQLLAEANLAELYLDRRRFRKAKRLCRRLLARGLSGCEGAFLGETYKHLGVSCRETNDAVDAERYFAAALATARRREDLLLEAETLREAAVLHSAQGRNREMLAALNRAHALFTQLSARPGLSDVERRLRRLETQFVEVVRRWSASIESADRYTQGHCERVAHLACRLAVGDGIDGEVLLWFRMGALLHDVGKIATPLEILNKHGALTEAEAAVMREHPVIGETMVADVDFPWDIRAMIRHHHERWDGTGYPDGLAGERIPRAARIVCIADVYDALTTTRSYRAAFTPEQAAPIMAREGGRVFDPALLGLFMTQTLPELLAEQATARVVYVAGGGGGGGGDLGTWELARTA